MNYIVDQVRPRCTVEISAFRALVHDLSPSSTVVCGKTLSKKLADKYDAENMMLQRLAGQPAVCTSTDNSGCL